MKPVLVLQHLSGDGPGYLGTWLARQGVAFEVRNTEAGDDYPARIDGYAGLAVLGGAMSANDDLPSLRRAEDLIRQAMQQDRPVIGHCLGGQLMARALGMRVGASPAPEVGWQTIAPTTDPAARDWFGDAAAIRVFHWHYESFEVPPGAAWLARSAACPHQAFAIGPHLAMQFHIEVDADKVTRWSQDVPDRHAEDLRTHPSVQSPEAMRAGLPVELAAHQALADRIYARWARGLA